MRRFFPHGNGPRTPSPVPQNEQRMPSPIPQNEQHAPSPPPGDGPRAPSPVQQNEHCAPSPQNNDDGEPPLSEVNVVCTAQEFICALREATLGDKDIASLLNPDDTPLELDPEADRDLLMCMRMFIAQQDQYSSDASYTANVAAVQAAYPDSKLYLHARIKKEAENLSGASAEEMNYLRDWAPHLLDKYNNTGHINDINDICCGTDFLDALKNGVIKETDAVLMFSFDGAQLYQYKTLDCWIFIWVIINLSPDRRYTKKHIIPGAIIPGPNPPKIHKSFLFPSLYHVEAVNKAGGIHGPGMEHLTGLVGHSGKMGCRYWCGFVSRHKTGKGTYYPVHLKPDNYTCKGCNHPDVSFTQKRLPDPEQYNECLEFLVKSNLRNYETCRRETGIVKPSLFTGLSPNTTLGFPNMFPGDIMHFGMNIAEMLMLLWCGTMKCDNRTDLKDNWHWAVLQGGADVQACTPYLPGSFDRPPRNPAEKMNSGYKAWEWLLYIFGLGPGLLYGVLPFPVWQLYCKMVKGIRLVNMKKTSPERI
ncbi:hypothetical protein BDP27DRAFT_1430795 [Rhodocollybia butyracea]|uniref:Uncharacterized protein n=1 Tax=Rhodocollybia butyracea TaxID=206335 RepID=A0A9P5PAZ5_9AGAR|nr:hypothetical protein BDP27DRAFT_1430795 [Rhodocollybia butyracea]